MRNAAVKSIAVGFFDGVHVGHLRILEGADMVLTFSAHPLQLLAPERAPKLLMTWDERVAALREAGIQEVLALPFTADTAAWSRERFVDFLRALASPLDPSIRCGANWRFGCRGEGNPDWLASQGIAVTVVDYAEYRGEPVSSTRIRASLESGALEDANAMLSRPYEFTAVAFKGKGEGRKIGFPTLNLKAESFRPRLPNGVYVVELGGLKAVANYGIAPTFGDRAWSEPVWEVHFVGLNAQYLVLEPGEAVKVRPLRFIRPERRFASTEDLQKQIAADCAALEL